MIKTIHLYLAIAGLWLFSLIFFFTVYAIKLFSPAYLVLSDPGLVIDSAASIFGMLVPQLTFILSFLIANRGTTSTEITTWPVALLFGGMTAVCQFSLAFLLIYGVLLHGFVPRPDGEALIRNTSIVVAICTILSFLGAVPVAVLFKRGAS